MNRTLVRLAAYIAPSAKGIWGALGLAGLISGAELLNPYIMEQIIDRYLPDPQGGYNIYLLGGLYCLTAGLAALCQYAQAWILNRAGQGIIHHIRMDAFRCLAHMPFSFFDQHASGRLLTRVTSDMEALSELCSNVVVSLVKDILLLAGIVVVMLRLHLPLALVSFSILPLMALVTVLYNKRAKGNFKEVRALFGAINGFLAENLSGMRLVQAFNRQKEKFAEFKTLNDAYNKASVFGVFLNALFKPGAEWMNALAISILVWYAAGDALGGRLEIGVLYAFITYIKKFFGPINDLADKYSAIQTGIVSAERVFELLGREGEAEPMGRGLPLPRAVGDIEFRNVWFAYTEGDWVLKNISFRVAPGQTLALVGHTGSGKTTIVSLLSRFYLVQKGEILLDGKNINAYRLEDLRKNIGVVLQDVFLFASDIRANIRLNSREISDAAVEAAADFVNAGPFIRALPKGFDQPVTERGATFSAGQRQLLNLARVAAFRPPVLVLDEATANIDTENEAILQASLEKIAGQHTTVVIAHRLSTVARADRILVLNKGEIAEAGRHQDLIRQNGTYRRLYETQFAE
jgi:ATP-binding cassette subfamily B protein